MQDYLDTVSRYVRDKCDSKGVVKEGGNNLTDTEQAGLDEIRKGVKEKGWMIYCSDKSGKVVLDSKANFLACMEEHYQCDKIVSPDEVRKAEEIINDHVRSWCQTMEIGEASGTGQPRRCRRALLNNYSTIPSLQGLHKDHKGDIEGNITKGPK